MTQKRPDMLVDQKCVALAKHFLSDLPHATAEDLKELSEAIQRVCEEISISIESRL